MTLGQEVDEIMGPMFHAARKELELHGSHSAKRQMCNALHTIAMFAELDAFDKDKVAKVREYAETLW